MRMSARRSAWPSALIDGLEYVPPAARAVVGVPVGLSPRALTASPGIRGTGSPLEWDDDVVSFHNSWPTMEALQVAIAAVGIITKAAMTAATKIVIHFLLICVLCSLKLKSCEMCWRWIPADSEIRVAR